MNRAPLKAVQAEGDENPRSVQKRASVHHKTVTRLSQGEQVSQRRGSRGGRKASAVTIRRKHPALVMAHKLGVPEEHVQILRDGQLWSAVLWNHPAPWPEIKT